MKKEYKFRFKHFTVIHQRSAMKVGVDGVLIGAWASVSGANRILDVGCGCGLIALMAAQRNPQAEIVGIEIDGEAVEEARENAALTMWRDNITIIKEDFSEWVKSHVAMYDCIVSNPPFYVSGHATLSTKREIARQSGSLSPLSLLEKGKSILSENGRICLIVPTEWVGKLNTEGLFLNRICYVKGHPGAPVKRAMCEYSRTECELEESTLTLHDSEGNPTQDHINLCKDFYLKF